MNNIPEELGSLLVKYVDNCEDAARLSMVSKKWNKIVNESAIWKKYFEQIFGTEWLYKLSSDYQEPVNWRDFFYSEMALSYQYSPSSFLTTRVVVDFDATKKTQTFAFVVKKIRTNSSVTIYGIKLHNCKNEMIEMPSHRLIDTPYELPEGPLSYFQLFGKEHIQEVVEMYENSLKFQFHLLTFL